MSVQARFLYPVGVGFIADRELRAPVPEAGDPVHVGAYAADYRGHRVTATAVVRNSDRSSDNWQYGAEVPMHAIPNSCQELPLPGAQLLFWSGIEIRVEIATLKPAMGIPEGRQKPRNRTWFVVASLAAPGGTPLGWSVCAPLRDKIKPGRAAWNRKILDSVERGRQLLDLPHDPFLNENGIYAARLNDPMRLHYQNGRNLGGGFLVGTEPEGAPEALWHFGICTDQCLGSFGIDWRACQPAPGTVREPGTGNRLLRAPRTVTLSPEQADAWHALAGRSQWDDETTLPRAISRAAATRAVNPWAR